MNWRQNSINTLCIYVIEMVKKPFIKTVNISKERRIANESFWIIIWCDFLPINCYLRLLLVGDYSSDLFSSCEDIVTF